MTDQGNNLDDHFREKLEELEISPPERVWSGIASHLDKKRRRPLWLWWLSGLALLIVAGTFAAGGFSGSKDDALAENSAGKASSVAPKETGSDKTGEHPGNASTGNEGSNPAANDKVQSSPISNATAPTTTSAGTVKENTNASREDAHASSQYSVKENSSGSAISVNTKSKNKNSHSNPAQITEPANTTKAPATVTSSPANTEAVTSLPLIAALLNEEQQEKEISTLLAPFAPAPPGENKNEDCPKWSVGINYAYGLTYRHLKERSVNSPAYPEALFPSGYYSKAHYDSIEYRKTGTSTGISVNYNVHPRVTISAGLDFSRYSWGTDKGEAMKLNRTEPKMLATTCTGYFYTDTLGDSIAEARPGIMLIVPATPVTDTVLLVQNFNYTSIPLSVAYSFTKPCSKFGVAIKAGAAISFLRSHRIILDGRTIVPEQIFIRKSSLNLMAGVAVSYSPLTNLTLELQPVYRRFVQPVNRFKPTAAYPYMLGLQGGMYFRF